MHEIERTARGSVAGKVCELHNKMDAPGCAGEASMWPVDANQEPHDWESVVLSTEPQQLIIILTSSVENIALTEKKK